MTSFLAFYAQKTDSLARFSSKSQVKLNSRNIVFVLVLAFQICGAFAAIAQDDPCEVGKQMFEEQRFLEARENLRRCLDINGESLENLIPLTVMAVTDGRYESGLEYGSRAVAIAPDNADSRYWYGRALLRSGQPEAARKEWEAGLQVSVTHRGLLEGMARMALADNEPAKAYNLLTQLMRQGSDEPWLHRLLAEISADKGLWDTSVEHLEIALAKDGDNTSDLLLASQLSLLGGKQDKAIAFCRRAVVVAPIAAAHGSLGEAYFSAGEMDSALVYLTLAVSEEPENPHFHFNLANILEISERFAEADAHFKELIKLAPEDPVAHFNYGIHLSKLGQVDEALGHIEEAIVLDETMLSAHVVRARLLEDLGRLEDALLVVNQLIAAGVSRDEELTEWSNRLQVLVDKHLVARQQGKIHLLHMVVSGQEQVDRVLAELKAGQDFEGLVIRFSSGAAAARGGDIGWVTTQEMVEPMRSAIEVLNKNDISPPIESGGLYHFFKRVH